MQVRIVLLVLGCAAVVAGGAEGWRVSRVDIPGLPRGIRVGAGFVAGDTVDAAQLECAAAAIGQGLMDEGFLRAQVKLDTAGDPAGLVVRYVVEAGARVRIARWQVAGDESIAGRPVSRLLSGRGTVFSKRNMERSVARVLAASEQNGFPLAEVFPAGVRDSAGWVIPGLDVAAGPKVAVGWLEFRGADGVAPQLGARLARFRPGLAYTPGLVRFWRANLEQSRVVRVAGHEVVQGDGYGVRFFVSPGRPNRALAAVGYSTEDRAFTGMVELDMGNILATGRRLRASWRALPERSYWFLGYTEPWVLVSWLGLEGSVRHVVFDTTGSRTSLAAGARIATETGFVVSLSTGYDQVASTDTTRTSSTVWAGTGLALDTREDRLNPGSGVAFDLRTTGGNRTGRTQRSFIGRFEADAAVAGPRLGSLVLANSGHYRLAYSGAELSELEWYRLGGARSLRGFREDEFSGAQLGWWNCEFGWQMGANAVGYPFVDAGVCETGSGWVFAAGYGLGLRVATRIGLVEADYGIGYEDSPARGKVHLGFTAEF